MASDVDRILQAVPIETYIQKYVKLKRKGTNLWGLCPFHSENTPSFSVSPQKGIFKCFGCGKGGNLFTFVQTYERLEFKEALEALAEFAGITLQRSYSERSQSPEKTDHKTKLFKLNEVVARLYVSHLPASKAASYLQSRSILEQTIADFQIGYAPEQQKFLQAALFKGQPNQALEKALHELGLWGENDNGTYERFRDRLMIPIRDLKGRVAAFGGRILNSSKNVAKYMNSPESTIYQKKSLLFHLYECTSHIRNNGQVIIVEGYFDVIGLVERDVRNVVAPLGTALTTEQARIIKRYTDNVVLFFDSDDAGNSAAVKAIITCRQAGLSVKIVQQASGEKKDPFDISREYTTEQILLLLDNAKDEVSYALWYFFRKKDAATMGEKRQAIDYYFDFVRELPDAWEQHEYIQAAAKFISIPVEDLKQDFNKTSTRAPQVQGTRQEVGEKEQELTRSEVELLTFLLQFDDLWDEAELLNRFIWKTESGYLLYSFFHDRRMSGEVFPLQQIRSLFHKLPAELSGPAATLMDVADHLQEENIDSKSARSLLQKLIVTSNVEQLEAEIIQKQHQLQSAESLQSADEVEELTVELSVLMREKKKFQESMPGIRHNIYNG